MQDNLITRYQPPPTITTHRQMFLTLAIECGVARAIADEIWWGAGVDLLDLKLQALEKLKVRADEQTRANTQSPAV